MTRPLAPRSTRIDSTGIGVPLDHHRALSHRIELARRALCRRRGHYDERVLTHARCETATRQSRTINSR